MRTINPILAIIIASLLLLGVLLTQSMQDEAIKIPATTTTSLYATGLLETLADAYNEEHGSVEFQFIPVGSGEALRRAAEGDACMVFVHAPSLEVKYIENGVLEDGVIFAYNYFIIVGPPGDPAGIRNAENAVEAFKRIYMAGENGKAIFVSRGDNSGTHVKELSLWESAGLDPRGKAWYKETGSGMAETLMVASELEAYTLSDIGTFLKVAPQGLEILYYNSTELINIYSAYITHACTPEQREEARAFLDWLISEEAQAIIESYGVKEYGQPLFYPAMGKEEELAQTWRMLSSG